MEVPLRRVTMNLEGAHRRVTGWNSLEYVSKGYGYLERFRAW